MDMEKLELDFQAANNRLLARKIHHPINTQISSGKSFTSITQIQQILDERAKEPRQSSNYDRKEIEIWLEIRKYKQDNFGRYLKACGVPRLFIDNKLYEGGMQSLFITGGFGTGKTHKAVAMLKAYVMSLNCLEFQEPFITKALFITVPELLIILRSTFDQRSKESEATLFERFCKVDFLILDDIGVEKVSDWVLQSLYVIINKRYSEQRQTIFTSNLNLSELKHVIGERITSRIAGMCRVLTLKGLDKRVSGTSQ